MKVEWQPAALTDLRTIIAYIEQHNRVAAIRLLQSFVTASELLDTFPHRGRPGPEPGLRELLSVRPYRLVYRIDDRADLVRVVRVWHGAMRR